MTSEDRRGEGKKGFFGEMVDVMFDIREAHRAIANQLSMVAISLSESNPDAEAEIIRLGNYLTEQVDGMLGVMIMACQEKDRHIKGTLGGKAGSEPECHDGSSDD